LKTNSSTQSVELEKINDSGLVFSDQGEDLRGRKVFDSNGAVLGRVSSLFVDGDERKVRFLELALGGFMGLGERHALLPVDAITRVSGDSVYVSQTHEHIAGSPAYDPELVPPATREYWEPFYGYYGLSPYWGATYMYPNFPFD